MCFCAANSGRGHKTAWPNHTPQALAAWPPAPLTTYTSSKRMSVWKRRMSASVRRSPAMYRCRPRISSHRSRAEKSSSKAAGRGQAGVGRRREGGAARQNRACGGRRGAALRSDRRSMASQHIRHCTFCMMCPGGKHAQGRPLRARLSPTLPPTRLVRPLAGGKAATVHAVVDLRVNPAVGLRLNTRQGRGGGALSGPPWGRQNIALPATAACCPCSRP